MEDVMQTKAITRHLWHVFDDSGGRLGWVRRICYETDVVFVAHARRDGAETQHDEFALAVAALAPPATEPAETNPEMLVHLHLIEEECEAFDAAAKKLGMTRSAWIRFVCRRESGLDNKAARHRPTPRIPTPDPHA
jgi:hypothetical protein